MIHHVVMFRWKPETPDGQVELVHDALGQLPGLVPTIRSYDHGSDLGAEEGTFDYAISATFDDLEGWRAYDRHPDHEEVRAKLIRPWVAQRASTQFET